MNFIESFLETAKKTPEKPALIYDETVLTYGELDKQINRFGNMLARLGVYRGDRVALMLNNRPEFAVAYYGAVKIGAVIVPVNTFLLEEELKFQLNDLGARVFVGTDWVTMRYEAVEHDVPSMQAAIFTGKQKDYLSMDEMMKEEPDTLACVETNDDEVAVIKYTSGTTGKPKGAMQTHKNIYAFLRACEKAYGFNPDDRPILFVPLFHGFGDHCCMNQVFMAGASMVIMDPFRPDEILSAIQKHKCTYFGATPNMLYGLMNWHNAASFDVSSLKYVLTGGGPVSPEITEGFKKKFGVPVLQGYGMTEGCAGFTFTHPDKPAKEGSCGVALPGVLLRILDEDGKEMPKGGVGEIWAQSDFNMPGYWNNKDATQAVYQDGWLKTGDMGKIDKEGYLTIVDRKKDMIIMSGENIYPAEIENVLLSHPAVGEAAVIGKPDARRGEIPAAAVVKKFQAQVTEDELVEHCKNSLASFKVPREIKFVDALPKNTQFKVLKRELRKQLYGA